jgi:predicted nucleic acid-binding protein
MMKRNESDAGPRIAVTQSSHDDALAPADVPLRAGDAIHTATALETGETEIWTNDSSSARGGRPFRPRRAQCLNGSVQSR